MANLLIMLFACLLTLTGLAIIHASWQRHFTHKVLPLCAGWALLAIAAVPWMLALGGGIGITLGLLVPSLCAWFFVAGNSEVRVRKAARADIATAVSDDRPGVNLRNLAPWQRNATLLLLTVPLAAVCATFTSVAFANLLPWSELNRMVLGVFLMPVVWGALAFWQCADPRWQRPALVMVAATLGSAVLLFS